MNEIRDTTDTTDLTTVVRSERRRRARDLTAGVVLGALVATGVGLGAAAVAGADDDAPSTDGRPAACAENEWGWAHGDDGDAPRRDGEALGRRDGDAPGRRGADAPGRRGAMLERMEERRAARSGMQDARRGGPWTD